MIFVQNNHMVLFLRFNDHCQDLHTKLSTEIVDNFQTSKLSWCDSWNAAKNCYSTQQYTAVRSGLVIDF